MKAPAQNTQLFGRYLTAALAAFTFFSLTPAHAALPQTEIDALVELYDKTNGDLWTKNGNWKNGGDPCSWHGITCDSTGEHVEKLELASNNLSGTLPDLSPLSQLTKLDLGSNNLSGTLPDLSPLSQLVSLSLRENSLSGSLPDLSQLSKLKNAELDYNSFTGPIPALPDSLTDLNVENNSFSALPLKLPDSLENIYADNNQLTGKIPNPLPASLQEFHAQDNFLSGPIPAFPDSLGYLGVSNNFLTGLPPKPNKVLWGAGLCKNRLPPRSSAQPLAADWDAKLPGVWEDDCYPTSSATITVDNTAGGGSISCPPSVPYGDATCAITPDAGNVLKELVFDPANAAAAEKCSDTECTIWVKGAGVVTVKAVFITPPPAPTPTPPPAPTPTPTPTPAPAPAPTPTPCIICDNSSPTLGELGLLLSGIALAGVAAPALRRRERKQRKQD